MTTFTYKFYKKAEDAHATLEEDFVGTSEKEVMAFVHDYCGTYGFEAYVLVKAEEEKAPEAPEKKVWTADEISRLVQTNDVVLYRALLKLYGCQTHSEVESGKTHEVNGVGFNKYDSGFLTSVAEFLNRNGYLTEKQKAAVRKKLVKYTKQLTRLANA